MSGYTECQGTRVSLSLGLRKRLDIRRRRLAMARLGVVRVWRPLVMNSSVFSWRSLRPPTLLELAIQCAMTRCERR